MKKRDKKASQFGVRVSGSELAALRRAADAAHLTVAAYVRQKALAAADRDDPEARRRRAAELVKRLREMPAFDRGDE